MKMREDKSGKGVMQARDFNCTRCMRTGKRTPAVCFVGMADPDCTQYPMCRKHADEWKNDVLMAACGLNPDGTKMREPESP